MGEGGEGEGEGVGRVTSGGTSLGYPSGDGTGVDPGVGLTPTGSTVCEGTGCERGCAWSALGPGVGIEDVVGLGLGVGVSTGVFVRGSSVGVRTATAASWSGASMSGLLIKKMAATKPATTTRKPNHRRGDGPRRRPRPVLEGGCGGRRGGGRPELGRGG